MLQGPTKPYRRTPGELRAIGFHLADLIETKAAELRAKRPDLSRVAAINHVIAEMAGE